MNQMNQLKPMMPMAQPVRTGVGAVEINIMNPTAQTGQTMPLMPAYLPNCYYPNVNMVNRNQQIIQNQQVLQGQQSPQNKEVPQKQQLIKNEQVIPAKVINETKPKQSNTDVNTNLNTKNVNEVKEEHINKTEITKTETKPEEKKEKKNVVPLTNEYLHKLDDSFNSQDESTRVSAIKEVLQRFKEDDGRKSDVALTNLLNRALSDGSSNVRFLALATLNEGVANGDKLTYQTLQNMTTSTANYGEDARLAKSLLVKLPTETV